MNMKVSDEMKFESRAELPMLCRKVTLIAYFDR